MFHRGKPKASLGGEAVRVSGDQAAGVPAAKDECESYVLHRRRSASLSVHGCTVQCTDSSALRSAGAWAWARQWGDRTGFGPTHGARGARCSVSVLLFIPWLDVAIRQPLRHLPSRFAYEKLPRSSFSFLTPFPRQFCKTVV